LHLDIFSLSHNQIDAVDSRAFYGFRMLRNIDLSCKNLQFINASMFSDNPVLRTVPFSRNPVVHVCESFPILASHSVTSLDLSFCSLNSLNSQLYRNFLVFRHWISVPTTSRSSIKVS
jgi:hypothetical protein